MRVLRSSEELADFLGKNACEVGCFADTGFLYGLAYEEDRLFDISNDVHEVLSNAQIPIYANVISRLELVDLVMHKQITVGCIELFRDERASLFGSEIFRILKDNRDRNTAAARKNESYRIDENRLKRLRKLVDKAGMKEWLEFCDKYVGSMLLKEWKILEQELGINFVEVMEGELSSLFNKPLLWQDMVEVMATHGQRGPDAMIANLFEKSKFELLITGDRDLVDCLSSMPESEQKTIFLLQ